MKTYIYCTMQIHDPETYSKYTALTPDTLKKYGGVFLTRGDATEVLEGEEFKDRMVLLEFPSLEAAENWYNCEEYQSASKYRRQSSVGKMVIQEARGVTDNPDPLL
ncbi:MAG: DUF1330 domain-containing protein [Emcibacteraceae bacterium]|nr:DUF1330 domain-containing protein [Emcibacteraceae bacterium]MDG1726142.1 DUF1330 domain-containing protein [Emcibacteraceae bacterium]